MIRGLTHVFLLHDGEVYLLLIVAHPFAAPLSTCLSSRLPVCLSVCLPSFSCFVEQNRPCAFQLGEPEGAAATSREGGDGVGGEREGEAG